MSVLYLQYTCVRRLGSTSGRPLHEHYTFRSQAAMLSRPLVKVETVPWLSLEVCLWEMQRVPKLSKSDLVCSRKLWSSLLESANLGV